MAKKFQVRVHVQAQDNSPEMLLVEYLNSGNTLYSLKNMGMIALKNYWLPLAYRDKTSVSLKEKERVIWDCIYRLKLQVQSLQEILESESTYSENSLASVQLLEDTTKPAVVTKTNVVKKLQVRFQVQTQDDSLEAVLLAYLTSGSTPYPFDDMAITALRSFWLPLAYRSNRTLVKLYKDRAIQDCIYRLKLQEQYLQGMLGTSTDTESSLHVQRPEIVTELAVVVKGDGPDDPDEEVWDPYENQ